MKNTFLVLTLLFFTYTAEALVISQRVSTGEILEMQSTAISGTLKKNAVASGVPESDVIERIVSESEYKTLIDSSYAPIVSGARDKKLAEIKQQAVERFKGYELYADMQSVIDYKAALRAVPSTAQAEMAALPDVASVKNYQPTWPAKPIL